VLGFVPLGEPRVAALESVYDPPKTLPDDVSGIILLSGSEQRGPSLRWDDPQLNEAGDRVIATARLARALPQTEVIITGGAGHRGWAGDTSQASLSAALLMELGIVPARITLEENARNTAQNADFSRQLVRPTAQDRFILVTSGFHMPRSVGAFCAAGWTGLIPWPTDFRTARTDWPLIGRWQFRSNLDLLNRAIREHVGMIAYGRTGRWIAPDSAPGCLAVD
ncbi:MAG: YdcF family protein, partial [Rhodobacteraceae bacterium]|nr:YdcF family protein [Paracoccaceae bacterium]